MNRLFLPLLAFGLMPSLTFAAKFANQFVEFELPPQWQCSLEGSEWVCQNTIESKKKDAIIVLAAKLKGDQDSIDQYLTYLKSAKSYTSIQGKPLKSEPKYAKTTAINSHPWVDALHFESEVPGFYTRYLATIKEDIGVLVTYSINKNKYQDYIKEFETLINTLKVFRKKGALNPLPQNQNLFERTNTAGVTADTVFPVNQTQPTEEATTTQTAQTEDDLPWIPIAIVGAGALVWWIKRKQNDSDSSDE